MVNVSTLENEKKNNIKKNGINFLLNVFGQQIFEVKSKLCQIEKYKKR